MRYEIKALDANEGIVSLQYDEPTEEQALDNARVRGLSVISVRPVQGVFTFRVRQTASLDVLLFSQELYSLLSAGLTIVEALNTISRKEHPSYKRNLIEGLLRQLREGKSFAQALQRYPKDFPPLYLALAAASDRTGDLPEALSRFIAYRSRMDELRKRIVSALLYPALLTSTGGLVMLFLMFYVVPRFARIYQDFGRELPLMSRLLMKWGSLVTEEGAWLGVCVAVIACLIVLLASTKRISVRTLVYSAAAATPLRNRLQLYDLANFYRTTGLLQQGGIPLVAALKMAANLLADSRRASLATTIEWIKAGRPLSAALEAQGLAPPVASDLIKIGEKTGALGDKLLRIAAFYDDEQSRWLDRFSKLFEPILMLGIGLLIAFVIVLLYLPIFQLAENLQ